MSGYRTIFSLFLLSIFVQGTYNLKLSYDYLLNKGFACPHEVDSCRSNGNSVNRSCECDILCDYFGDCCVDAPIRKPRKNSLIADRMTCIAFGGHEDQGVYVINRCGKDWKGTEEVRQNCERGVDMSDPLLGAPVTDIEKGVTYRNSFCAACNYRNDPTSVFFQIKFICKGLSSQTEEQIFDNLEYDKKIDSWGVKRFNPFRNSTEFNVCEIIYDVPNYIDNSVRFCHPNLISTCPSKWTNTEVKEACNEYMAVVYDSKQVAYKNIYCALCNGKAVNEMRCWNDAERREKLPFSFTKLLDVNQKDGHIVGMRIVTPPSCPPNHKYFPQFKKCKELSCALPGYIVRGEKCVPG